MGGTAGFEPPQKFWHNHVEISYFLVDQLVFLCSVPFVPGETLPRPSAIDCQKWYVPHKMEIRPEQL